jgi:hypothetical protein
MDGRKAGGEVVEPCGGIFFADKDQLILASRVDAVHERALDVGREVHQHGHLKPAYETVPAVELLLLLILYYVFLLQMLEKWY